MKPTDRYAMRDARIRETRQNEARILLHDEIQGYRDRIAELEIREARQNETVAMLQDEIRGYKDRIAELGGETAEPKPAQEATAPKEDTPPIIKSAPSATFFQSLK